MTLYFAKDGMTLSEDEWRELRQDWNYVRVAKTVVWDRKTPSQIRTVSTTWTGTDYSGDVALAKWLGMTVQEPVQPRNIFEVYTLRPDYSHLSGRTVDTLGNALSMHQEMVEQLVLGMRAPVLHDEVMPASHSKLTWPGQAACSRPVRAR